MDQGLPQASAAAPRPQQQGAAAIARPRPASTGGRAA
jgi:hypothetical protein